VCEQLAPSGGTAGNRTRDLSITNPMPYHYTTKPQVVIEITELRCVLFCQYSQCIGSKNIELVKISML